MLDYGSVTPGDEKRLAQRLQKGERFVDRYEILDVAGAGGAGLVYEAHDRTEDCRVALKILHLQDQESENRFLREARMLAQMDHPALVRAFDYGEHDGTYYLVLDFVQGPTLKDLLRNGAFAPQRAVRILETLLQGIAAAHDAGIIHRDIKPENIIVNKDASGADNVKLVDFGLAKQVATQGEVGDPTQLTRAGSIVGSLRYMAPEQVRAEPMTPASDLFSLGLVALEMLVGEHPLAAMPSDFAVAMAMAEGDGFELPAEVDVGAQVRSVINRMLRSHAAQRHQSAREALDALTAAEPTVAMDPAAVNAAVAVDDGPTVVMQNVSDALPQPPATRKRRKSYVSLVGVDAAELGKSAESAECEPPPTEPAKSIDATIDVADLVTTESDTVTRVAFVAIIIVAAIVAIGLWGAL